MTEAQIMARTHRVVRTQIEDQLVASGVDLQERAAQRMREYEEQYRQPQPQRRYRPWQ